MNLGAVVLAGGQSRRMGCDKAWLEVDGQPLIARTLSAIRESGIEEIFISGRAGVDYSALDSSVLLDRNPNNGPLGGIERALESVNATLLLVLAVDLPNMTVAFIRRLAAQSDSFTGVVPQLNGELEPLAAIYPKACHAIARDCLRQSRLSARDFAKACLREKLVREFPVVEADAACFHNWNTPSDLDGAHGISA